MLDKAKMRNEESSRRHYWRRARFLLWQWRQSAKGLSLLTIRMRLLKYLRLKHLQAKEIDFTELN
jgi:hypothetical protein